MNCTVNIDNDTMTITVDYPELNHTDVTTVRRSDAGFEISNMDLEGPASHILRMTSSWILEASKIAVSSTYGKGPTESSMLTKHTINTIYGKMTEENDHSIHDIVFDGVVSMISNVRDLVFSNRYTGDTFVREVKKVLNDHSFDVCEAAVPSAVQTRLSNAFADAAKKISYKSTQPERDASDALGELDVMVSDIFKMIGVRL